MDAIVEAVPFVMQWPGNVGEVVFGYIGHGCLLESVLLELFSRDLLPHAISRGRYFLAAKAAGAGVSFPLADTVFNTSFPSGCSISFHLLKRGGRPQSHMTGQSA